MGRWKFNAFKNCICINNFFIQGTYNIPVLREEPNRKQHNACSILKFVLLNVLNFTEILTRLAVADADTLHYDSFFFLFPIVRVIQDCSIINLVFKIIHTVH